MVILMQIAAYYSVQEELEKSIDDTLRKRKLKSLLTN